MKHWALGPRKYRSGFGGQKWPRFWEESRSVSICDLEGQICEVVSMRQSLKFLALFWDKSVLKTGIFMTTLRKKGVCLPRS